MVVVGVRGFTSLLIKQAIYLRRYLFNSVSSIIEYIIVLGVLLLITRQLAGSVILHRNSKEILISGTLAFLGIESYSLMASGVISESQEGTLEQLAVTPLNLGIAALARSIPPVLINLLFALLALGGIGLIGSVNLQWSASSISAFVLSLPPVLGLGLVVGGLGLLFKQVAVITKLLQYTFVVPVLISPTGWWADLVPLSLPRQLLEQWMSGARVGTSITGLSAMGALAIAAFGYLTLGLLFFDRCVDGTKSRGLMGQY